MLHTFKVTNYYRVVLLLLTSLLIVFSAEQTKSQSTSSNPPGPDIREGHRSMDDYDRAINRMKNDAKAANERRRNLFPQINEDFQRIQVIHNEMVRMLKPDKALNYERLIELTDDLKKRSSRLRENLALPQLEKNEPQSSHAVSADEAAVKNSIGALHDLIVEFVANPIFKNLGVIDAKTIDSAGQDLDGIISISDEIKREAKVLSKVPNK